MNYLRSNDVSGGYGGYPFALGRGNMFGPVSAHSHMTVRLRVLDPGTLHNQFYLPEISGCWQLDGQPCNGSLLHDVTRYVRGRATLVVPPRERERFSPASLLTRV